VLERLVLFGASGDLAGRYLLPALAALLGAGELPEGFEVVGAAQSDWDDDGFRGAAAERLERHGGDVPAAAREALIGRLRYRQLDAGDPDAIAAALAPEEGPLAVYLALPPSLFPAAVDGLSRAGLADGSRLALEKPFGESFESARELNARLVEGFDEEQVFRVDHALGMPTVQNLLALRFANRVLEPLWSSEHIAEVEVPWEETLALEGRAGYYDGAGALEDVVQNHVLQVMCIVAMEPPAPGSAALHERKTEVLGAVRPVGAGQTRRARYTAGRVEAQAVPSYVDEDGVDPGNETETFTEVRLAIDNPRWRGTPFVLRAGKAMSRTRKGVIVRFRPSQHPPYATADHPPAPNELRIGIDGPTDIRLDLSGGSEPAPGVEPLTLESGPVTGTLPAYGRVLCDFLSGGSSLSVGSCEAELAWRIFDPVLAAWAAGSVPLEEYPAGSAGP
jgi:glucose-6-phosphate 1-dehydrogenase